MSKEKESTMTINSVIFVTVSMRGGGTERVISILSNELAKQNKDVHILMIADDGVEYPLDSRVQVTSVSGATGGSLSGRIKRIRAMRAYFRQNPDAGIIAMGTVAAMFTVIAHTGLKQPLVVSERNDPNRLNHQPIKPIVRHIRNLLYTRAKTIVLQTRDGESCFPERLQKKAMVIPNPLSDTLPPVDRTLTREKTVITAGRLTRQKNHKLLMDSFKEFAVNHADYRLNIFGRGEMEEELQNYIHELSMEGKITLCGFSDDLYAELAKGGIYVSSSDWEGISNSLLEALAMGIPTIATDCPMGGSRMSIRDGENGLLIPMQNKEKLVEALGKIADDEEFADRLSRAGEAIREKYSQRVILEQWMEALGEVQ